ncbi:hypothetical protein POM88_019484 [Heracleum sosnowskyi]|uniref:Uncharacterized protein n=1 Tax=Heracleum sosnowskyi TaxID=360622 RepID=A0AAD8IAZ6_9APIA|nr:hypothetical protein POM88_019484 [Heracleum sosnowskyi]
MSVQIGSMEVHNLHPEMPQNLKDYISEFNLEAPPLFVAQKLLHVSDVMQDRLLFPESLINAEFSYNFLTEVEKELLEKQHVEVNLVDGMMREYHALHLAKWDIASCSFYVLRSGWNDAVLQNKLSVSENFKEDGKVSKTVVMVDDNKSVTDLVVRVWSFRRGTNLWFALEFHQLTQV